MKFVYRVQTTVTGQLPLRTWFACNYLALATKKVPVSFFFLRSRGGDWDWSSRPQASSLIHMSRSLFRSNIQYKGERRPSTRSIPLNFGKLSGLGTSSCLSSPFPAIPGTYKHPLAYVHWFKPLAASPSSTFKLVCSFVGFSW